MVAKSLVVVLALALGACSSTRTSPAPQKAAVQPPPSALSSAPVRTTPQATVPPTGGLAIAVTPLTVRPVSPSNPSPGIVDVNRSVVQPLGPNSPPPSSFENSCAPAPYVFQSLAGYEAVRVKDCRTDQLLYLPSSAQAQIDSYVSECRRRCGQG